MATRPRARHAPTPGDVLAALDRIRAEIDALRLIVAGEASMPAAERASALDDSEPEWVNLATAAALCRVHPDTMANRCRINGLGWRPGGGRDYRVDMVRVRKWQEGRPYEPLPSDVPKEPGKPGKLPDECGAGRPQIERSTRRTST